MKEKENGIEWLPQKKWDVSLSTTIGQKRPDSPIKLSLIYAWFSRHQNVCLQNLYSNNTTAPTIMSIV